ncbi:glycoside hydrolase family 26 protein [Streptomyces apocyni]|uniref:glycoside hydrolase family 26 protein n=1 Tax=Streptomyces apocyni TaxID=2654677 RepID=UPI0012EA06AA|nr:glycosyl hydrolase [Streptomyces apocyni]
MAPPRQRTRSWRPPLVATAGMLAAAVLASGAIYVGQAGAVSRADPSPSLSASPSPSSSLSVSPPPPPSASTSTSPSPSTSASPSPSGTGPDKVKDKTFPAFGAYLDYGPRGVTRMAELSKWLGKADLRVGHTYLPGDRWSNIAGAPRFLETWAEWRRERDDRLFVLNVPMMERNEGRVTDAEVRTLLRRAATGEFDRHFRTLAERLVDLGVPDTVIVLGWEMNGVTYTHRCGPDPKSWKTYWKRIVTAMRAVPGQEFQFDFAPNRGRDAVPWTQCYPGDDVVDIIGMDSYDQPTGLSFDEQVSEPYGLQAHVDFARERGKPISYPEWGLFRNGDNPEYMRRMLAWIDEHKPLYNTITDYCPHGVWLCGENPRASRVYQSMLSGRVDPTPVPTSPVPTPVVPTPVEPTPEPTQPVRPPRCSYLDLGDWVEYWLGGKLCIRFDWWERRP